MFKRLLILVLLILSSTQMGFADSEDVLVLYDAENYYGDTRNAVVSISNLLRHFDKEITYRNLDDFEGSSHGYGYIMVLNFQDSRLSEPLLKELQRHKGPILWIGQSINQLTQVGDYDLHQYGKVNNLTRVVYKDRFYDIGIKRHFEKVSLGEESEVFSYLYDGSQKYPFIVRDKNLYYVSRMDLNEPLFYIFADVLYTFFDQAIEEEHRVLIKIADVNPYTDSEALLEKVTFLLERRIPFAVSVSPLYREKGSRYMTPLSEREDLVKVLKFVQENSQSLIVQGGTQYIENGLVEGENYFEWRTQNSDKDNQADQSIEVWVEDFFNQSLNELGYNALFPIGAEASHYVLSEEAYTAIGGMFDLYLGTLQTNDWQKTVTVYPWVIEDVSGLNYYVPDNLGFFSGQDASELEVLKSNLDKMDIVSEFVGGISIAPELDIQALEKLIRFLESRQLSFYDLREIDVEVRGDKVRVISNQEQLLGESDVIQTKSLFVSIIDVIFALVLFVLTFVFFLFYKMFKTSKQKTDNTLF
jgi:uncharacterized protein YdaL